MKFTLVFSARAAGLIGSGVALYVLTVAFGPIVPVLAALLLLAPHSAFAFSIDIGPALNASLQDVVATTVTTLITALIGWGAFVLKSKWNIEIAQGHRDALTVFLNRQASSLIADRAVKLNGVKIEVQNEALAVAANAGLQAIPAALNFFKLTPESIAAMIVDLLPKQPAVAQAQAVAIDVQNPGTPSMATAAAAV